jgi:hypothetical protein
MKKAKIFLSSLTVLAISGGALAFKVKGENVFAVCDITVGKCVLNPTTKYETTTIIGAHAEYDLFGKDCISTIPGGQLVTCTTLTTAHL